MFMLGREWQGFTKTAVFWQSSDERYEVLLDEADSCDIPWEVQRKDGFMFIGLLGRSENVTLASKVLIVPVNEGTQAGTSESSVTQPVYDTLIAQAAGYADSAKASAAAAQESLSGTMKVSDYDADGDGVIDNASSLGGVSASEYATIEYVNEYVSQKIDLALEGSY